MKPNRIVIIVPPGLEDLAMEECQELGLSKIEKHPGWLVTYGHDRWVHRLNNLARLPSRVLIELTSFKANSFSEFEAKLNKAKLGAIFQDRSIALKISVKHCRLYHTGAIEERILRFLGRPGSVKGDESCMSLFVRGEDDVFTLSLDSTGDHLHRRGLALHRGVAPLRENLAAALVREASPSGAVWDPTCGSGTLILETILRDTRWPLNRFRKFAFEQWPTHQASRYQTDLEEMEKEVKPLKRKILASDLEEKELDGCRANLERAGCLDQVEVFQEDVTKLNPEDHLKEGVILANPPYGERIAGGDEVLRSLAGWGEIAPALGVHMVLPRGLKLAGFQRGIRFKNGGLGVGTYHHHGS